MPLNVFPDGCYKNDVDFGEWIIDESLESVFLFISFVITDLMLSPVPLAWNDVLLISKLDNWSESYD